MKYFIWDNLYGVNDLTEEEYERSLREYREYYQKIRSLLPATYIELNEKFTLHDSRLQKLRTKIEQKEVYMELDGWSIEDDPGIYELFFRDIKSMKIDIVEWGETRKSHPVGFGDLLYVEVEHLEENLFESRILFWSKIEISIQWGKFDFSFTKNP